jgi:hypothetical protein
MRYNGRGNLFEGTEWKGEFVRVNRMEGKWLEEIELNWNCQIGYNERGNR